jgi:sulfatase modifying factor 1
MTNCGPGGSGTESCCTNLEVPGGTYYQLYNINAATSGPPDGGWPDLGAPATITGFRMDKYLVTVGRFRQFVNAWNGGWLPTAGSGKHAHLNGGQGLVAAGETGANGVVYEPGWDATDWNNTTDIDPTTANLTASSCGANSTWTSSATTQESLPIDCVTWYEAEAFCIWDGGFLPSEAEWEYVAAGGSDQREYPWGAPSPGTACPGTGCSYAIYNCDYPNGSGSCSGVADIAPVGYASQGAGKWGQIDMAGEVSEWALDYYNTYADPCPDCASFLASTSRVVRGGYFNGGAPVLLPQDRSYYPPAVRGYGIGFRCARTP